MSDKFASTASLLSSHAPPTSTAESKKSGLRGLLSSQKSKPAKKDKATSDKAQQESAAWSDSKFAEMSAKNGWAATTASRPSF